ncbi:bifunctional 2-C-methyl-D-erythritol 4-phosphate cytidylyltransferase/2-C-methyl-D-erythritol 2,4-cyclodiphosphate synthase [Ancylobacter crimeensis]
MTTDVVVVAAGRGLRAGAGVPKQLRAVGGKPLLRRTVECFSADPRIRRIRVVIHQNDEAACTEALAGLPGEIAFCTGGETRQASVKAGLEAIAGDAPDLVLIHDAARPFLTAELVGRAIEAAASHGAAVPALTLTDTVKAHAGNGTLSAGPDREGLRRVQTPQAFRFPLILAAHRALHRSDLTDDAAVAEAAGHPVFAFSGEAANVKITTAEDFVDAERQIALTLADVRSATGYDVHAFGAGDHVMLGGIAIPHIAGLAGHSDADVVLHALTDAVLGTLGDGDIGSHFPPSDPQWKGASSDRFLAHAIALLRARGGIVAHLDSTVVCEAPKIGPHREAMRARIAEIAGIPPSRVSVKATTSERLGFTGRREGIAALATATVRLPWCDE